MSKSSKHRECPAVNRTISPQECGENRNSRHACPALCAFNPFAPANYSALLELEAKLDAGCTQALKENRETRERVTREVSRIDGSRLDALNGIFCWELFLRRDAQGRTWAENWQASGCGGWKNDMRSLLKCKATMRAGLLEVQQVPSDEETLVKDLLRPERGRFPIRDKAFAAKACRYDTIMSFVYDMPFFSRIVTGAVTVPDLGVPPLEAIQEIARHLGGPAEGEPLALWLAEHHATASDALWATGEARQAAALNAADLRFGKAVYELRAPFAECRDELDRAPGLEPDSLTASEKSEGFAEARVWFSRDEAAAFANEESRGRVLLGQTHWRLEAMGEERTQKLRACFEKALGERVQFEGMRLDDLRKPSGPPRPNRLVPPRFLENLQQISLSTTRMDLSHMALEEQGDGPDR